MSTDTPEAHVTPTETRQWQNLISQLEGWEKDGVCTTVVFNFGGHLVAVTSPEWVWKDELLSAVIDSGAGLVFLDHTAIVAMTPAQGEDDYGISPQSFATLLGMAPDPGRRP